MTRFTCALPVVGMAILAGSPSASIAQEAETAKLVTEDAFPVDPGSTEFEFGYQFISTDSLFDNDGAEIARGDVEGQIFVAKVTRGMRQHIDVSIEVQWHALIRDQDDQFDTAIGNVTAAAKWLLLDNKNGLAIAWVPGITAPVSSSSTGVKLSPGQKFWSVNNLLVLSYVSGPFNMNVDAGHFLAVGGERGDQRSEFIGDIAVGWQFRRWLQLEAELNFGHVTVGRGNSSTNSAVSAGAIMNLSDSFRVDVGFQRVLDGRNADKPTVWIANLSKMF